MGTRSTIQASRIGTPAGRLADDPSVTGFAQGALADLLQKLRRVELTLSEMKGPFDFFGLILREDSDKWDLLTAARWFGDNDSEALALILKELFEVIAPAERMMISRVIALSRHDRFLRDVMAVTKVEHGLLEIGNTEFGEVAISRGYVITSGGLTHPKGRRM